MTPTIAIVADDLTGSGDTAVQFVRAGWSTHLSIGGAEEALSGPATAGVEVLAVTTHSRALPAADAARVIEQNVRQLRAAGVSRLYKRWTPPCAAPSRPRSTRRAWPGARTR